MPSVWPSGGALTSCSVAMMVPPPPRLSTTTDWPKDSVRCWASMRASRSAVPPGVNGTISRTLLVGAQPCAAAGPQTGAAPRVSASSASRHLRIGNLLGFDIEADHHALEAFVGRGIFPHGQGIVAGHDMAR